MIHCQAEHPLACPFFWLFYREALVADIDPVKSGEQHDDQIDPTGVTEWRECEGTEDVEDSIDEDPADGGGYAAYHRDDRYAGGLVLCPAVDGDGVEFWELPEKQDEKYHDEPDIYLPGHCCIAARYRHGARDAAHGGAVERQTFGPSAVQPYIRDEANQADGDNEPISPEREDGRAEHE